MTIFPFSQYKLLFIRSRNRKIAVKNRLFAPISTSIRSASPITRWRYLETAISTGRHKCWFPAKELLHYYSTHSWRNDHFSLFANI